MAKLYFYYSAMNAGKTTTLLQSAYNYEERGMKPLLFTPEIDVRDNSKGTIKSRIGLSAKAFFFLPNYNFYKEIKKQNEQETIHCVLVDEAQFLSRTQVMSLSNVADRLGIPVLTYGIRTDFKGELFPGSLALLAVAEELIEIKTICFCGRKATMNIRIDAAGHKINEGEQVQIGGNDRYIAVCHKHFKAGASSIPIP